MKAASFFCVGIQNRSRFVEILEIETAKTCPRTKGSNFRDRIETNDDHKLA